MRVIDIKGFRQHCDREFVARGFRKAKIGGAPVYILGGGEVERLFYPQALRRPWGCQMQGYFGVEVPPLRRWLVANGQPERGSGLAYYMTNEAPFFAPVPVVTELDLPRLSVWIDAISERVLDLPSSLSELEVIWHDCPMHLLLLFESNPDFWQNFRRWRGEVR